MPMDYKQYQEEVTADVAKIIADASCQPILFIGSGFTKRYAKGPNWPELLGMLAEMCPQIDKDFAYYKQAYGNDLMKIGSVFSQLYHEWGWNAGKENVNLRFVNPDEPLLTHARLALVKAVRNVLASGLEVLGVNAPEEMR